MVTGLWCFPLQELKRIDLDKFWNPLLYIDNILSETKEATWLTATVNHKGEAYILERRRVRGIFMENLELNDFPLDVQVRITLKIITQHKKITRLVSAIFNFSCTIKPEK